MDPPWFEVQYTPLDERVFPIGALDHVESCDTQEASMIYSASDEKLNVAIK